MLLCTIREEMPTKRLLECILSARDGKVFSASHLKFNQIVELSCWWARGHSISNVVHETSHSSRTIMD